MLPNYELERSDSLAETSGEKGASELTRHSILSICYLVNLLKRESGFAISDSELNLIALE